MSQRVFILPEQQERFWSRVTEDGDCWIWTGSKDRHGYGQIRLMQPDGRLMYAHRFAYESMVVEIPEGLVLDHLCRTPACVNPDHLDPVPNRVNVQRGMAGYHHGNRDKPLCQRGLHDMKTNAHVRKNGSRYCRPCANERERARRKATA